MPGKSRKMILRFLVASLLAGSMQTALAYEVAPSLGSTAPQQATIDMGDRTKWPMVADLSWGPLANLAPIGRLTSSQRAAVFRNFKNRRAIAELPYKSINWTGTQGDITFIESYGFSVPYLFVLDGSAGDSMLTRDELRRVRARFPSRKIIMNTHTWVDDKAHVESIKDLVDGICIEYFPHNAPFNIALHVAPFARWAYTNKKILMFLMPPAPLETNFSEKVTRLARIVYEENKDLPKGWLQSDQFIFAPANYTFGASSLTYVPETSTNTVLGAARALLLLRPELDAGPVDPDAQPKTNPIIPMLPLLLEP